MENYFQMNLPKQKIDAISNLGLAHIGDGVFEPVWGVKDKPLKPQPDAALEIAAMFGARPDEMCFVGDSHIDMQTGKNAGMHPIGVSYGYKPVEVLRENGAEFIADKPENILEIAKSIK